MISVSCPYFLVIKSLFNDLAQALVSHYGTLTSSRFPDNILIATGNNLLSPGTSWPLFSYLFHDTYSFLLSLGSLTHWFLFLSPIPPSTVLSSPLFFCVHSLIHFHALNHCFQINDFQIRPIFIIFYRTSCNNLKFSSSETENSFNQFFFPLFPCHQPYLSSLGSPVFQLHILSSANSNQLLNPIIILKHFSPISLSSSIPLEATYKTLSEKKGGG